MLRLSAHDALDMSRERYSLKNAVASIFVAAICGIQREWRPRGDQTEDSVRGRWTKQALVWKPWIAHQLIPYE